MRHDDHGFCTQPPAAAFQTATTPLSPNISSHAQPLALLVTFTGKPVSSSHHRDRWRSGGVFPSWHGSMDGLPVVPGLLGRVPSLQINTMDEPSPFRVGPIPTMGQLSSRASQRPWPGLLHNARCGPMTAGNWVEIRIAQWLPSDSRSPEWCVALLVLFPPFFLRRRKLTFPVATQFTARFCRNVPLPTKTLVKPNCACPAQLRWVEFAVTTRGPADCRCQGARSAHA